MKTKCEESYLRFPSVVSCCSRSLQSRLDALPLTQVWKNILRIIRFFCDIILWWQVRSVNCHWPKLNEAPPIGAQSGSPINSPQKIQDILYPNFHFRGGGGGVAHQPTFDGKSKNAKIQISILGGGGGLLTSQLLMPSPKMLNSKFPFSGGGGGGVAHQSTFDAKSKNAKLQISIFGGGGRGGVAHQPTFDAIQKC